MNNFEGSYVQLIKKIKLNQISMMINRGYDVKNEYDKYKNITLTQMYDIINVQDNNILGNLSNIYTHTTKRSYVAVLYLDTEYTKPDKSGKINKYINDWLNLFRSNPIYSHPLTGITDIMFITQNNIDNKLKTILIETLASYNNVQYFIHKEFYVNIINNVYVPNHEFLNRKDARNFLKRNNLSITQLPKICYDDPIVKYYGAKIGQIVKIHRITPDIPSSVNKTISYRTVYDKSIHYLD